MDFNNIYLYITIFATLVLVYQTITNVNINRKNRKLTLSLADKDKEILNWSNSYHELNGKHIKLNRGNEENLKFLDRLKGDLKEKENNISQLNRNNKDTMTYFNDLLAIFINYSRIINKKADIGLCAFYEGKVYTAFIKKENEILISIREGKSIKKYPAILGYKISPNEFLPLSNIEQSQKAIYNYFDILKHQPLSEKEHIDIKNDTFGLVTGLLDIQLDEPVK